MANYTINADGSNFSEDWDSINITINRDGYDGPNYAVVAVSGSASPGVWENQYKPSIIQALGGNGNSAIPFVSQNLPYTLDNLYSMPGMSHSSPVRVIGVNSDNVDGADFVYNLNLRNSYSNVSSQWQNTLEITKVDARTGNIASNFGNDGRLELKTTSGSFNNWDSPEIVVDASGNLYITDRQYTNTGTTQGIYKYSSNGDFIGEFQNTIDPQNANLIGVSGNSLYYVSSDQKLHAVNTSTGSDVTVVGAPQMPYSNTYSSDVTSPSNPLLVLTQTGSIVSINGGTYQSYSLTTGAIISKDINAIGDIPVASTAEHFLSKTGELYLLDESSDRVWMVHSPDSTVSSYQLNLATLQPKFAIPSMTGGVDSGSTSTQPMNTNWQFQGVGDDGSVFLKATGTSAGATTSAQANPDTVFVKFTPNTDHTSLDLDTSWGVDGFAYHSAMSNSNGQVVLGVVDSSLITSVSNVESDYHINGGSNGNYPQFIGRDEFSGDDYYKIQFNASMPTSTPETPATSGSNEAGFRLDSRPDSLVEGVENISIRLVTPEEAYIKFGSVNGISQNDSYSVVNGQGSLTISLSDDNLSAPTIGVDLNGSDAGMSSGAVGPYQYFGSDWTTTGYQRNSIDQLWNAQIHQAGGTPEVRISLDQSQINQVINSAANNAHPVLSLRSPNTDNATGEYSTSNAGNNSPIQIELSKLVAEASVGKSFLINQWDAQGNQIEVIASLQTRHQAGQGSLSAKDFVDVVIRSADGTVLSDSVAQGILSQIGVGFNMPSASSPVYTNPMPTILPTVDAIQGDGSNQAEQGIVHFSMASPLMMGQSITIGGLTFTATMPSVSSIDVANSFANMGPSGIIPSNSFGTFTGSMAGWTSSAQVNGNVTFTSTAGFTNIGDLTVSGNGNAEASNQILTPFNESIDLIVNIKNPDTGLWEGASGSMQTDTHSIALVYVPPTPFDAYFHGNVIALGFVSMGDYTFTTSLPRTITFLSDETDWDSWQGNPDINAFQVTVNGQSINVQEAFMQKGLYLITDQAIDPTASVSITYTNNSTTNQIWNILQDERGTDAPSFQINASYSNPVFAGTVLPGAQFGWSFLGGHEESDYFGDFEIGSPAIIEGAIIGNKQLLSFNSEGVVINPHFDQAVSSASQLADYEYLTPQLQLQVELTSYNLLKGSLGRIPTFGELLEPSGHILFNSFQWNALASHTPEGSGTIFELVKYSMPNAIPLADLVGFDFSPLSDLGALSGGNYDDVLTSLFGNQTINGGAGNDFIYGGPGNDTLIGGSGDDTVVYLGNRLDYTVTEISSGHYSVTHNLQNISANPAPFVSTMQGAAATYERAAVTFNDLNAGESVTVNGLTYTANVNVSGAEVANAFANRGSGSTFNNVTYGNGVLDGVMGPNFGSNGIGNADTVNFTASYMGNLADLQVSGGASLGALMQDGVDSLSGVENIEFSDITIHLIVPPEPVVPILSLSAYVNAASGAITVDAGWTGSLESINYSVRAIGASYSSTSVDALPGDGENFTENHTDSQSNIGVYAADLNGSITGDGTFSQTTFMANGGVRDVTISMLDVAVDPVGDGSDLPVEIPAAVTLAMGATLSVTGTPNLNVTEGSNNAHQTVTINVALDRPILTNQTLSWSVAGNAINGTDAVSGADFVGGVLPTGTLTLLAGTTTGQITFQIAGDNAIERAEGYQIVLSGTSGLDLSGIAPLAGTIANDDRAVISISALSAQAVEGDTGSTPYQMTVTLDQASFESQTVDWATEFVSGQGHASAADFALGSALSGSVTFAAGETSKTITLNVAGDTIKEGNESFSVRLSNSMGDATISPINGVLSAAIKDDDGFDVGGHVYFWGGGVASKQFVMDDVDVSVQQLLAGSVQTLIDTPIKMQNIKLNTDSHLATADLWLEHTDVTSFSFTSSSSLPAGAVFTKSPLSNWNVVQTIDENGLLHVSGNYTGAVGTQTLDAMKIGVMSFVTPAEDASPLSFKLLDGSVSNDAGFSKTISPVEAKITFADTTDVSSPGDMLDGQYTLGTLTEGFYGIDADRDFTLSTKDANGFDIWSNEVRAITAADARACLLISQGKQVSAHELIAADVNGSGTVTAADARDILLMSVKNTAKLTTELEWKFVDEDADLSALTKNNVKEGVAWKQGADISVTSDSSHNLVGILMGDLNASYTPDYAKVTPDQAYIW